MRRWLKVLVIVVAIAALAFVVVRVMGSGDSGGFGPGGHTRPGGSSSQSSSQSPGTFGAEQQAAFAQCMREQGIDFRSQVGDNGQVEMSPGPGVDVNGSAFRKAQAACRAKFASGGGQPSGTGRP